MHTPKLWSAVNEAALCSSLSISQVVTHPQYRGCLKRHQFSDTLTPKPWNAVSEWAPCSSLSIAKAGSSQAKDKARALHKVILKVINYRFRPFRCTFNFPFVQRSFTLHDVECLQRNDAFASELTQHPVQFQIPPIIPRRLKQYPGYRAATSLPALKSGSYSGCFLRG